MTNCPLSGHGQGHVSNLYIVDFENFATASRRSTGVMNELLDGRLVDYTYNGRARRGWMHTLLYCDRLTPLLRFVLKLSYKLYLHCYAAVGKKSTDTSRRAVRLR